jgi:uncharacterized protein YbjQ (UPF0145 family)
MKIRPLFLAIVEGIFTVKRRRQLFMENVLVSTTQTLEGYRITSCLGPIVIPIVGAGNMVRDWFAGFTDVFGGKSQSYQKVFAKFLNQGVMEMIKQAKTNGANAVINLRIETTNISGGKSVVSIILYGTAVIIEKIEDPGDVTGA